MLLKSKLFYIYIIFVIIYACFTLLPAPNLVTLAEYNVSAATLRLIDITIVIILSAIWLIGLYGYTSLRNYSYLIKNTKDGKQVAKLANGVFWLIIWLPLSSVTAAVLNYIASRHAGIVPTVVIINNYVNLILPLIGFIIISLGTRGLSELVKQRPSHRVLSFLVIFLIYSNLIYYHLAAAVKTRKPTYHLSIWWIITTIVAPYAFMWFTGLLASYELYLYQSKIKGIVYKKSWNLLSLGIAWLIVTSIAFQYLSTLTPRLTHISIYWVLAIIYSLLTVLSVGFVIISIGARQLQLIEEI
jgi:hypothetical protein